MGQVLKPNWAKQYKEKNGCQVRNKIIDELNSDGHEFNSGTSNARLMYWIAKKYGFSAPVSMNKNRAKKLFNKYGREGVAALIGLPRFDAEKKLKAIGRFKKKKYKEFTSFYETRKWRELRYKALVSNGRKCQCCGAMPPKVVLHVDHIKPRSLYPELELEIDNLQILCEDCNIGKSNQDETDFR